MRVAEDWQRTTAKACVLSIKVFQKAGQSRDGGF
jgi:hypothetical protein